MKTKNLNPLDNPAWHSLSESHKKFAVDYTNIKFYHPDYCPFGGFIKNENISESINEYSALVDNFFIIGEKPGLSNGLRLKKELVCLQMIIKEKINLKVNEEVIKLTVEHDHSLYQLVNLVQPGYFKKKTALLGEYFGILVNGELRAVTGERMKMNDFTEISAIVTHPDYTGKGYAKQLITHTVNNIFGQHKLPYLHVVENNTGAIKLYEKMGFTTRRKISFWNITSESKKKI